MRGGCSRRHAKALINTALSLLVGFTRKLLEECCDPGQLFAMTKLNSPMGKNLWFDGEFLYSVTIDNATYSLFPQVSNFYLSFLVKKFYLHFSIQNGLLCFFTSMF